MKDNKYLSEEKYQKNRKKISVVALIILIVGLLLGGSLILLGITKINNVNSEYSDNNKETISAKLEVEKTKLENKKEELKSKGIEYDAFADYEDGEVYDLYIITRVLDPSFDSCAFDEYSDNDLTEEYCELKEELEELERGFNKKFSSVASVPFFMIGGFVIFATLIISGSIYMITKRREIAAFTTQQMMPVAKEGIEEMAPSIGAVAKEVASGIKEGLKDEENK